METGLKNYYLLMHFDGHFVTGMLALDQQSPEHARKTCIRQLSKIIVKLRQVDTKDDYSGNLNRYIAFRRTLSNPWRIHTDSFGRKHNILEIMELTMDSIITGYWLGLSDHTDHLVNISRSKTQDLQMGYIVSCPNI